MRQIVGPSVNRISNNPSARVREDGGRTQRADSEHFVRGSTPTARVRPLLPLGTDVHRPEPFMPKDSLLGNFRSEPEID